jgi:hypothetical protein
LSARSAITNAAAFWSSLSSPARRAIRQSPKTAGLD